MKILKFLFLSSSLFIITGCLQDQKNEFENNLKKFFEKDTLVRIDSLISKKGDMVCILYPYENSIIGEDDRINKKLQRKNIIADEGTWYLIVLQDNEIVSIPMNRSIDVLSPIDIKRSLEIKFPNGFNPAQCVNFDQAYFYKISVRDRNYIILGSIK